jgi:methyltransferase (TIGR00027 family)
VTPSGVPASVPASVPTSVPASLPLPSVSLTAVGVAAIRAAETSRPDRLFDDPCAIGFVRAANYVRPGATAEPTPPELRGRQGLVAWIAVRTRFLDDVLLSACAGGCRQVVILGAGLDARGFRLDLPARTRLWELDLADILAFKETVVAAEGWRARCRRSTVTVDLSEDWGRPLTAAGFDPNQPVVWLAEGLVAYLPEDVRDALIRRAAELSVPGSRMGLTLAAPERLDAWRRAHPDGADDDTGPGDYVALWRSTAPEDPIGWLASSGWRAEIFDVAERSQAYGRPLGDQEGMANASRLVDAVRV